MNIQQFLEEEKRKLFDLHCINGAMYFGVVEEPCSGRETGECCQNEQTWGEAEKELNDYLKDHDTRLINKVLDEVRRGLQAQGSIAIDGGQFMYSKDNVDSLLDQLKLK